MARNIEENIVAKNTKERIVPDKIKKSAISKKSTGETIVPGTTLLLGNAISIDEIVPGDAYVLLTADTKAVLAARGFGSKANYYDAYSEWWSDGAALTSSDLQPIYFSKVNDKYRLSIKGDKNGADLYFQPDSDNTSWDWAVWGSKNSQPALELTFENGAMYAEISGTKMGLCLNVGQKNGGAFISSQADELANWLFKPRIHRVVVKNSEFLAALEREWPEADFNSSTVREGDSYYEVLLKTRATEIWNDTGLKGYAWKKNVFDCDDFAICYKAQAARDSYNNQIDFGAYAVGVIWGIKEQPDPAPPLGHAVNVFVDFDGSVNILEPQNGSIIKGSDWDYKPYFVFI